MYGMCGKLIAQEGKRADLVAILTRAAELVGRLPACKLYVVGEDRGDPGAVWVTEIWDTKQAHDASLQDDRVRALIAEAMPLLGGPPEGVELDLVGGHGIER